MGKHKRKGKAAKRRAARQAPPLVVINGGANPTGMLVGQILVAGLVYGGIGYLMAEPKRRSRLRFVARHPAASLELAAMAGEELRDHLRMRGQSWLERVRDRLNRNASAPRDEIKALARSL